MAKVARSSATKENKNVLRVHKVKVYMQRYAGKLGADDERTAGSDIEYNVYIDGSFSQSGKLESDGSAEILIPGGCVAQMEILGTKFDIEPISKLEDHSTLEGVQQRLRLFGYMSKDVDGKWDGDFDRAVLNFQADYGLDTTGKGLDSGTYNKIKAEFGE